MFLCHLRNFEEVIAKYAHITPHERAKRKLENLEVLKKTFKKLDHDVNIENFMGSSYWSDLDKINNVEYLRHIEDLLRESVNRLHLHKENLGQHQLTSLESTIQVVKASATSDLSLCVPPPCPVSKVMKSHICSFVMFTSSPGSKLELKRSEVFLCLSSSELVS
ncbi:hypothetical protein F2P56_019643 [Juglans regia]|uniref:Uncharacterized protein n=1 Tax=Juglans regia TaxID=51240 RepID=A0A833TH46_JUGRE|nr:hypothetical protein F2P56_019643 [Juglans regia]